MAAETGTIRTDNFSTSVNVFVLYAIKIFESVGVGLATEKFLMILEVQQDHRRYSSAQAEYRNYLQLRTWQPSLSRRPHSQLSN